MVGHLIGYSLTKSCEWVLKLISFNKYFNKNLILMMPCGDQSSNYY